LFHQANGTSGTIALQHGVWSRNGLRMRNRLLIFGGFSHDSQGVLAVYWLAFVSIELCLDLLASVIKILVAGTKGLIAAL
jgi:hypothetical protein